MTSGPQLHRSSRQVVGVLSLALFGILTAVFLTAGFGTAEGLEAGGITHSIGYAMFNLDGGSHESEGFLVAFITIAIVLDAALDGAVMLATRDEPGEGEA